MGKKRMQTTWPEATSAEPEKKLSIRLDLLEEDHRKLKAAAAARRVSMATYARICVLEQIRKDERGIK